jgi:hypothetical protein
LAQAASTTPQDTVHYDRPEVAPLPGIFNTELPELLRSESLRLTLRPHFGDFISHDHLRITVAMRYGLTPNWELTNEVDTYVAHGFGDERILSGAGFSQIRLGAKYKFSNFLKPFWDTAAGVKYSFPVSRPPLDMTYGFRHISPYVTMAHKWARYPEVTGFVSYGVDFVGGRSIPGALDDDALGEDAWFFTPGVVWHRGDINYTLETSFRSTTGLASSGEYRVGVRPALEWTLPDRFTFSHRNRWVVGLGVNASYGNRGADFGVSTRIQTDFDFKRLFTGRPSK